MKPRKRPLVTRVLDTFEEIGERLFDLDVVIGIGAAFCIVAACCALVANTAAQVAQRKLADKKAAHYASPCK